MATLFVSIENAQMVARALHQSMSMFGSQSAPQLVQEGVEADVAITNSVAAAARWVEMTKQTSIVILYLYLHEKEEAKALASRFPDRVSAAPFVASEGEMDIVPFLIKLFAEKRKEVPDGG